MLHRSDMTTSDVIWINADVISLLILSTVGTTGVGVPGGNSAFGNSELTSNCLVNVKPVDSGQILPFLQFSLPQMPTE